MNQKNNTEQIKKIAEFSTYLENGEYAFTEDFRMLFNINRMNHPMITNFHLTKNVQASIKIATPVNDFDGSVLWFCINGDIKIFSEKHVLIICESFESYHKKRATYTHFSSFFHMPKVLQRDAQSKTLIEEFVTYTPQKATDEVFILKTIYKNYSQYFKQQVLHTKHTYYSINQLLETSAHKVYRSQFEKIIERIPSEYRSVNFPFLALHGDLWSDNLLLSVASNVKKLWYIDWETSSQYLFFYDFFKFMWNELDVHQNDSYFKNYLSGAFDEAFHAIFAVFQLEFQPTARQVYVCLFFLNFILTDTDNMVFKYKYEEIKAFEEKVFPLLTVDSF